MIVEFHGTYINLRGETKEERTILKEMYDYGIRAWGGGSYLSFSANEDVVLSQFIEYSELASDKE